MKLTQLRYFQTICKHNNITRAAAELHISQPSLSKTIHELEEEFGLPLFYRLSKGLVLTEEGEIFLQEVNQLLANADQMESRMHALGDTKQQIKLGVPPMLAAIIFPRLLQSFHASYPHVQLQMIENGTLTNTSMVLDGTLDAAIISSNGPLPPSLDSCCLGTLDICLWVSSEHPLANRHSVCITEIADFPLALLGEDSFLTSFMSKYFRESGLYPHVMVHTNQLATIYQLIEHGTAASFLYNVSPDINLNITQIPLQGLPPIAVHLIWNSAKPVSSGTQKLIHLAKEGYH